MASRLENRRKATTRPLDHLQAWSPAALRETGAWHHVLRSNQTFQGAVLEILGSLNAHVHIEFGMQMQH